MRSMDEALTHMKMDAGQDLSERDAGEVREEMKKGNHVRYDLINWIDRCMGRHPQNRWQDLWTKDTSARR